MTLPNEQPLNKLQFYVSSGYTCGYLPNRLAQSLIASPQHLLNGQVYSQLIQQGFRRSGLYVYRPHCERCNACTPVRIVLNDFKASRNQKRVLKKHRNLTVQILPVAFHQDHFNLYQQYQQDRHPPAATPDPADDMGGEESYRNFLCDSNVESVIVEFRDQDMLKMVSIIDLVDGGVSAVYTFFDTSNAKDSFGTYNVLWQIDWAKQLKLDYLYLGYWISDCQKMSYKNRFQPQQHWLNDQWQAPAT